ncbi:MAG: MFS transporter [Acidimicrobiales bacterium]
MGLKSRFFLLLGLRWFPVGLMLPVLVLFVLGQGFSLGQFGAAAAIQSVVVLALELPTGGLADVVGARRVLVWANVANLASLSLLLIASSLPVLMVVWALQGLYRALDSGPLEAWYVSGLVAEDPDANIERDLSGAGTILGLAIAGGSLTSSALVALAPSLDLKPLMLPIAVAIAAQVVGLIAVLLLVTDPGREADTRPSDDSPAEAGPTGLKAAIRSSFAEVRTVVTDSIKLVAASTALLALIGVEFLWGIGLIGFETLFPPRLSEVVADPESAARLLGPVGTMAFLLMAAGSSQVPRLTRKIGAPLAGSVLRVVQGLAVLALALFGGVALLIAAYLGTMAVHGASNVVHSGILHSNADSAHRSTVLSANSMSAQIGGGIGSVGLGAAAGAYGVSTAMIIAAVLLAVAAPLYMLAKPPEKPMSQADIGTIAL